MDADPQLHLKGHVDSIQLGSGSRFTAFPPENATGKLRQDRAATRRRSSTWHSLARHEPARRFAELFGKATGCSKGKGGSMHLFDAEVGNHGGHGIVGGHIPLGLGFAFAQQYKKTGGVTFCLFGDGAINQGTFNEALNMASLLKVPAIFIVENNGVAMGTQVERHSAEKDLAKRGCGFNMPHYNVDGNDVDIVITEFGEAADRARRGEGPSYIVANTYRFRGHSMSDPMKYRTKEEAEKAKPATRSPLYESRLTREGCSPTSSSRRWRKRSSAEVAEAAIEQADADPHPPLEDAVRRHPGGEVSVPAEVRGADGRAESMTSRTNSARSLGAEPFVPFDDRPDAAATATRSRIRSKSRWRAARWSSSMPKSVFGSSEESDRRVTSRTVD